MKKRLKISRFKNEYHEREFWSNLDFSEYFDRKDFKRINFPNLKRNSKLKTASKRDNF